MAQPCSLYNRNSRIKSKVKSVSVLTHQITSHSVVSSQRLALYQWQPEKKMTWKRSGGPS
jgi:hypothetical protein